MVIGTAWPVNQQYIELDDKVPVQSVIPTEGVTGWADTWMMSSHAQHPNCMLMWMQYTLQPDVQTQVAEFYGATPSNTKSCAQLNKDLGKDAADIYHCGDDKFLSSIALWKTPQADCGNGSDRLHGLLRWTEKWTEIRARELRGDSAGGGPAAPVLCHHDDHAAPGGSVGVVVVLLPTSRDAAARPDAWRAADVDARHLPRVARRCCSSTSFWRVDPLTSTIGGP